MRGLSRIKSQDILGMERWLDGNQSVIHFAQANLCDMVVEAIRRQRILTSIDHHPVARDERHQETFAAAMGTVAILCRGRDDGHELHWQV